MVLSTQRILKSSFHFVFNFVFNGLISKLHFKRLTQPNNNNNKQNKEQATWLKKAEENRLL